VKPIKKYIAMYKKDETNKEIVFSYPVEGIFESASRVSAYNSKNIRDTQGNSLLAEYAISDDEKDVFLQGLNSILPEIYEKILKITDRTNSKSATPAFGIKEFSEVVNSVTQKENRVFFEIKDNDSYNFNVLSLVDNSFLECIVEGSLKAWYKNCAQGDLFAMYTKSFADNLEKLFNRMFQLKIKKTTNMLGARS
jgi:hypothetical protein